MLSAPGVFVDGAPSLTELLQRFSISKDRELAEAFLQEALPKLHKIAESALRREQKIKPLRPTELINEAWATRLHKGQWHVKDRGEFFAIAAKAMRLVLVDMARRRIAAKRSDGQATLPLDLWTETSQGNTATPEEMVAIDEILDRLARSDPGAAKVFEMKAFAGFTFEEIALSLDLSFRQVRYKWDNASDWLKKHLGY